MKTVTLSFWIIKNKEKVVFGVLFIALFMIVKINCKQSAQLFSKGHFIMNQHLIPEYLPVSCGAKEIKSLPENDKFAMINGQNEFAIASLQSNGDLTTHVILRNYPNRVTDGAECEGLYSDDAGKIFWTIQTRAILALNTVTKKTFDPLFAFNGNTSLAQTIMVDNENEIIRGQVFDLTGGRGRSKTYLVSYNCKNDLLGEPGKPYKGFLFYLGRGEFLWCETLGAMDTVQWHVCDTNLENIRHNRLTEELTKRQITMNGNATPHSPKKKMMVACKEINDTMTYFSVRWNEDMSEVKIEPLILQIPQNGGMERWWHFSEDGNWLIATFWEFTPEEKQTIVFFHIDDKYPQGISLPVFGEETYYKKQGCFVNHSDLGPLYLDWSPDHANTLLVYRLNDVLKVLAGKAGVK